MNERVRSRRTYVWTEGQANYLDAGYELERSQEGRGRRGITEATRQHMYMYIHVRVRRAYSSN